MNKYTKGSIALLTAALAVTLGGCKNKDQDKPSGGDTPGQVDVEVTSVTCTETSKALEVGDTYKFTFGVLPENATNKTLTFSSSNTSVATVDAEGTVEAHAKGATIITATSVNGKTVSVIVSVSEKQATVVVPTELQVDFEEANLVVGDTKAIHATVLPDDATNKNVEYLTDSKTVATVSKDGVITAVGAGEAIISVISQGNTALRKDIQVKVVSNIVEVSSISVSESSFNLVVGANATIEYEVLPANATDKSVSFQVKEGDEDVVSVSQEGIITAKNAGIATIYVKSSNPAKFTSVTVEVSEAHTAVSSISLSENSVTLATNASYTITATVLPENATNKDLSYTSNDPTLLSISAEGVVTTATVEGTGSVTIQSVDNPSVVKVLTIKVEAEVIPVSSVAIVGEKSAEINISNLDVINLEVSVLPLEASDKSLKWSSNNTSVATVDQQGHISPKGKVGQAVITVESISDPSKKDEFTLTVGEVLVESIDLQVETVSTSILDFIYPDIAEVNTKTLTAVVAPANANDKSISWSSSNSGVATVENGVVTPKAIGTAVITATNLHSGVFKQVTVNVRAVDVEEVHVYYGGDEVNAIEKSSTDIGDTFELSATVLPENATNKDVIWSSFNTSVVTVDAGVVTVVGCGTAIVRAASEDNPSIKADVAITVGEVMVQSITLKHVEESVGETIQLSENDIGDSSKGYSITAEVYPATAYDKDLSWMIADPTIASLTDGKLNALKVGTTTLVVTNAKSGVSASVTIQVLPAMRYRASLPVGQSKNFATFKANSAEKTNKFEEYFDRSQSYKVGHQNPINLLPNFEVQDLQNPGVPVDVSYWAYDFEIEVFKKDGSSYVAAPSSEYSVVSYRTCDIQFTDAAIGEEYKVKVTLGNKEAVIEDEEDLPETFTEYELQVVNGRNIYNEVEMSYFDTTTTASYAPGSGISYLLSGETKGEGAMPRTIVDYPTFKTEHGLDPNLVVNNLVLHKNLKFNSSHIAPQILYSENEVQYVESSDQAATLGSMKDYIPVFMHTTSGNINIEGNYFKLDFSDLPLINRPFGKIQAENNKLDSHSTFFKAVNGTIEIKNLNVTGNAGNAQTDADLKYAGGLFFLKATDDATDTTIDNVLSRKVYITMMNEKDSHLGSAVKMNIVVNNYKGSDHYNCFLYNWGGNANITNSWFKGSGGPVIIQDHTGISEEAWQADHNAYREFDETHPYHVKGNPSTTVFEDCVFENNLYGSEAWFKSFSADSVAGQIKALSDTLQLKADEGHPIINKTFIRAKMGEDNYVPTATQTTAASINSAMGADILPISNELTMNMIVINKSGNTQGMTSMVVDGSVTFIDGSNTEVYNYLNPGEGTELATPQGQLYKNFYTLQEMGAPVVETTAGLYYLTSMTPSSAADTPTLTMKGENTSFAQSGNYISVYFNGMMIVFKLYQLSPNIPF